MKIEDDQMIDDPETFGYIEKSIALRKAQRPLAGKIFDGKLLFELKTVKGFPLELALDKIINEHHKAVDWPAFIDTARTNKWWDFQIYEVVCHAMEDAGLSRDMQVEIKSRFRLYMLANPHPAMQGRC